MWKGDRWLGEFFNIEVQYACYVHILLGYKSIPNFTLSTQASKQGYHIMHAHQPFKAPRVQPHVRLISYVVVRFFGLVVI